MLIITPMKYSSNCTYLITHQKVLNRTEVLALRASLTRSYSLAKDCRNALIITVILDCGLRSCEALGLRVKDLDVEESTVYIRSYKGSNARELPIKPSVARMLKKFILGHFKKDLWSQLDAEALVFDITYDRLYQIWQWYTPNKDKTFHSLRHTFAVAMYQRTQDVMAVKLALGHRKIDNTMVYVDFVYTQTKMRKLIRA